MFSNDNAQGTDSREGTAEVGYFIVAMILAEESAIDGRTDEDGD